MDFDTNTPRAARTIGGQALSVIQPFAAGQPLTEATAAMLNQTFAENISNNTRKAIETALAEGKTGDALQTIVDDYTSNYTPGVRSSGGGTTRTVDPVEREARKLAKNGVLEAIKARGGKAKDYDVAAIAGAHFEKNRDDFLARAKKIVAAQAKAAEGTADLLGDLGFDAAA